MVPRFITIHCSATPNDRPVKASEIRKWHLAKGWADIGYHAVVERDGGVVSGRAESVQGAHVESHNKDNLGICLVGMDQFTYAQFASAKAKVKGWMAGYGIPIDHVYAHNEFDTAKAQGKTCPNMSGEALRKWLSSDDKFVAAHLFDEGVPGA